ncbi:hypothetical protein RYZ44_25105, partial [Escherichia coli]|uniref:hypothetical protein n=1 Tax=Escherichia coli TaxID=562 RepID=UPI002964B7D0
ADRNRSHWSTSKTPSYTKSVSWQHHHTRVDNYLRNNAFPSMIQAFTASNPFSRILTVRN